MPRPPLAVEDELHAVLGGDDQVNTGELPGGMGLERSRREEGRLLAGGDMMGVSKDRDGLRGKDDQEVVGPSASRQKVRRPHLSPGGHPNPAARAGQLVSAEAEAAPATHAFCRC